MAALNVVINVLEADGYDAVTLRRVAQEGHISFATIYKAWPTRDALIVAAFEVWLERNRYAALRKLASEVELGSNLREDTIAVYRAIFQQWEEHPMMLRAYHRARRGPGGSRLLEQGTRIVEPVTARVVANIDPAFARDFGDVLEQVVYGLMGRFSDGEIEVEQILPTLERAIFWMTEGYEHQQERVRTGSHPVAGAKSPRRRAPSVKALKAAKTPR
ncbi:MAG: TetR family transcriptional regulator [Frankiales bacterium]|nr:TetR family transcriptional regulator [Frankiales bacterium]